MCFRQLLPRILERLRGGSETCCLFWRLSIFRRALLLGVIAALATATLRLVDTVVPVIDREDPFFNSSTYGGLVSTGAFLTVFRTSQAYARFWEGSNLIHKMMGNWVDAVSAAFAFTRYSSRDVRKLKEFKHVLVRLVSLLNAMVLGELEGMEAREKREFEYELLDINSLTAESLEPLKKTKSSPILVHHWVQELIVDAVKTGVLNIPPPLLTVVFQELGQGMVMYQEGVQLTRVRFPFPYTMTMVVMMNIISILTPVAFCTWTTGYIWPVVFTFLFVFAFWSLHFTAAELENPFGDDANDLDMRKIQSDVNARLLTLLHDPAEIPALSVSVHVATQRLNRVTKVSLMTLEHLLARNGETVKKRKSEVILPIDPRNLTPTLSQRLWLKSHPSPPGTRSVMVSTGATKQDRRMSMANVPLEARLTCAEEASDVPFSDIASDARSDPRSDNSFVEAKPSSDGSLEAVVAMSPVALVPRNPPKPWNFQHDVQADPLHLDCPPFELPEVTGDTIVVCGESEEDDVVGRSTM